MKNVLKTFTMLSLISVTYLQLSSSVLASDMSDTSDVSIRFVASEDIADNVSVIESDNKTTIQNLYPKLSIQISSNEDTVLELVDTTARNLVASESENGFTYVEDSELIDLKNNTVYNIVGSNPMVVSSDAGLNILFVNSPQ